MSVDDRLARHGHVSYLEIPAVDAEQSAAFYEAVFGWSIRRRESGDRSFDDHSGDLIGRWVTGRAVAREPGLLPFIYVDRIDEIVERVERRRHATAAAAGNDHVGPPLSDAPPVGKDKAGKVRAAHCRNAAHQRR